MKVKTIRPHGNHYAPQYQKNRGRIYEASERDAKNLIATGLVEEYGADDSSD